MMPPLLRSFGAMEGSLFQIRNSGMPMSAKIVVQTGPNTHAGGLRAGFTSVAYQPAIDSVVNTEPMMPASSETTMAMMSLNVLLIFILLNLSFNNLVISKSWRVFSFFLEKHAMDIEGTYP